MRFMMSKNSFNWRKTGIFLITLCHRDNFLCICVIILFGILLVNNIYVNDEECAFVSMRLWYLIFFFFLLFQNSTYFWPLSFHHRKVHYHVYISKVCTKSVFITSNHKGGDQKCVILVTGPPKSLSEKPCYKFHTMTSWVLPSLSFFTNTTKTNI